jgi:putative transposase
VARQCELLGLCRASYYYRPVEVSAEELALLRRLDEQYTKTPFYGVRRMTAVLRQEGADVGPKRVRRLLRTLGLWALGPRPGTSRAAPEHRVYPYLLRGVAIERVDHVWSTDITYIRLRGGFAYLAAVMDWYSRYVLSWALSNSLEVGFCLEVLEAALSRRRPEIWGAAIRGRSSRARRLRDGWRGRECGSAWTGGAGRWTTCSWSGSGAA